MEKAGRFVGFEIQAQHSEHLVILLKRIGLQFDATQTDLTIYLYHSSQVDPVLTQDVTTTKAGSVEWVTLNNFNLDFINDNIGAGGRWFIGYYEDDINGQAIKRGVEISSCSTCYGRKQDELRTLGYW